jgi:hypothetical protein
MKIIKLQVPVTVHLEQSVKRQKTQQNATIRCLLLKSVSTCFGHHYAHLQEKRPCVTAYGVLFWFCWMWLVAVVGRCLVGCEHCEGLFKPRIVGTELSVSAVHDSKIILNIYYFIISISITHYCDIHFL